MGSLTSSGWNVFKNKKGVRELNRFRGKIEF